MDFTHFSGFKEFCEQNSYPIAYGLALFAQARFETGNFTSNIYLNANNLFGMRPASVRPQNRVGIFNTANGDFALYADYKNSIQDRIALDVYNNVPFPETISDVPEYFRKVLEKNYIGRDGDRAAYYNSVYSIFLQELQSNRGSFPNYEFEELMAGDSSESTPMSFLGFSPKFLLFLLGIPLGFMVFKKFRKRFTK